MNARDIVHYGQQTVLGQLTDLSAAEWEAPGACGVWSVKDIIGHLASYEYLLGDVLRSVHGGGPTPYLDHMLQPDTDFNEAQVASRSAHSAAEALEEFNRAHAQVLEQLAGIPAATLAQAGTLPWYGLQYGLEDFIVYANYGHKREHAAQIAVLQDRLGGA